MNAKEIYQNMTRTAMEHVVSRTVMGREMKHFLEVQEDGEAFVEGATPLDYPLAAFDAESFFENNRMAKELREARRFLIEAGYYRVMTAGEIARTTVSRGSVWAFKIGRVAYTSDYPSCYINDEGRP